ncbi:hypothetical protein BAE44_0007400, partial [Dichanthelium oligosanthes]
LIRSGRAGAPSWLAAAAPSQCRMSPDAEFSPTKVATSGEEGRVAED